MPINESSTDRFVRIILGLVIGYISLTAPTGLATTIGLIISGILLLTGIVGFCPLYALLKISTKHG